MQPSWPVWVPVNKSMQGLCTTPRTCMETPGKKFCMGLHYNPCKKWFAWVLYTTPKACMETPAKRACMQVSCRLRTFIISLESTVNKGLQRGCTQPPRLSGKSLWQKACMGVACNPRTPRAFMEMPGKRVCMGIAFKPPWKKVCKGSMHKPRACIGLHENLWEKEFTLVLHGLIWACMQTLWKWLTVGCTQHPLKIGMHGGCMPSPRHECKPLWMRVCIGDCMQTFLKKSLHRVACNPQACMQKPYEKKKICMEVMSNPQALNGGCVHAFPM